MMVRSFDKRLESLFKVESPLLEKQLMNILSYNLRDNTNSYTMQEDGTYVAKAPAEGEARFNIHQEFFKVEVKQVLGVKLVEEKHVKTNVIQREKTNIILGVKTNIIILGVKINVIQTEELENKPILINKLNIKYNNKSFYYYV